MRTRTAVLWGLGIAVVGGGIVFLATPRPAKAAGTDNVFIVRDRGELVGVALQVYGGDTKVIVYTDASHRAAVKRALEAEAGGAGTQKLYLVDREMLYTLMKERGFPTEENAWGGAAKVNGTDTLARIGWTAEMDSARLRTDIATVAQA